ncbi:MULTISPECIES: BREX system P-loop protein BrxC [unclassified Oceanispirochaeta]|uniref:BREX system P-loop protein BrxC n=1 Tax=unclassified Oceanispirochaeta TaxID=2635722 RepID=UPI000E09C43C|nr:MULTISPECIES: BREX system P-loop protein BrxC [unclassified Oceanispirochaeta]MBF9018897.1 BREX system P-loop protein BrxC [Oceanispirochaeta sp. M2]NPD75396.1 BREX system P-loop protein BrxC [Oceanispirochaeta sp. M1]RDG28759.1 BREX system P-loop protein BrxC [Oceanispirochaeta sp. M1]
MLNRNIYITEPSTQKLANEGVAYVNDEQTEKELSVLRYELETFVCDGQYEKGMQDILDTYLSNIDQAQQPAVWISGFYGSGKSHLVKMLRALWTDIQFPDGATARGVADLPQAIQDHLKELTIKGKRYGGLHAASGTLGAGASGSVRLALMRIIFKSVGLPESYPIAKFVLWLKHEEIYEEVKKQVVSLGYDWEEELDNFYVAEGLHKALSLVKPNIFSRPEVCLEALINLYPDVRDITNEQMLKAIHQALSKEEKLPLILIVLDEVQQFIGTSAERSIEVQEMVESIVKSIGGKLMFIATGQTAVTGTANLQKLQGRFTVRVELSDADVDAVIRKVILAKKPEAKDPIKEIMDKNLGEISRHLQGTTLGHTQEDIQFFTQDYPILPVRRRFWERTLRVLDQTGTDSQLRNQLSMIHKVIQTNADQPLGNVIPADYLYFNNADELLQARVLPRKIHESTMKWYERGNDKEKLTARAVGLSFLINKLNDRNKDIGILADVDTLADLMVDNLIEGSSALRSQLPTLLDSCELLIRVGSEYRIQTEESAAWNDEYEKQKGLLTNESHRIETDREDRIRKHFNKKLKRRSFPQGDSKVPREISLCFDNNLPTDSDKKIYLWIRNGWVTDVNSVRADARQAGTTSPAIFSFIPSRSMDDLRNQMIYAKAANATLEQRGIPNTPEGKEARSAMETTRNNAEARVLELLDEALSGVRIFQGGGTEINGSDLDEMVGEAAANSLSRLFGRFDMADHSGWGKVYSNAAKGAPDALKAVNYDGEVGKNNVCKQIMTFIGGGKTGSQIRTEFENPPYGWSGDAVDGALYILLVAGILRVEDDKHNAITSKELERKALGKCSFYLEKATVTAPQKIKIKKLFQKINISCPPLCVNIVEASTF